MRVVVPSSLSSNNASLLSADVEIGVGCEESATCGYGFVPPPPLPPCATSSPTLPAHDGMRLKSRGPPSVSGIASSQRPLQSTTVSLGISVMPTSSPKSSHIQGVDVVVPNDKASPTDSSIDNTEAFPALLSRKPPPPQASQEDHSQEPKRASCVLKSQEPKRSSCVLKSHEPKRVSCVLTSQEQRVPRLFSRVKNKEGLVCPQGSCDYGPSKMSQEKRGPRVFSRVKNKEGLNQEQRGPRVFSWL
ncbi:hypothetical protein V2J09_017984 [Rumex salicifolius]